MGHDNERARVADHKGGIVFVQTRNLFAPGWLQTIIDDEQANDDDPFADGLVPGTGHKVASVVWSIAGDINHAAGSFESIVRKLWIAIVNKVADGRPGT